MARKCWSTTASVEVDIFLDDLDDETLLEEVEARNLGIVSMTAAGWCNALADAYQLGDTKKIYELNKKLIDEVTGRII